MLDDVTMFDYDLDTVVTAAALTGTKLTYPTHPSAEYPAEYATLARSMLPALGTTFAQGSWYPVPDAPLPTLTPLGQAWGDAVQQRSGGTRPGFAESFR